MGPIWQGKESVKARMFGVAKDFIAVINDVEVSDLRQGTTESFGGLFTFAM